MDDPFEPLLPTESLLRELGLRALSVVA